MALQAQALLPQMISVVAKAWEMRRLEDTKQVRVCPPRDGHIVRCVAIS